MDIQNEGDLRNDMQSCSQLEEYIYMLLPPYSLEILLDRRKRLLLILQRKSEKIKNLMENTFNVRAVSE